MQFGDLQRLDKNSQGLGDHLQADGRKISVQFGEMDLTDINEEMRGMTRYGDMHFAAALLFQQVAKLLGSTILLVDRKDGMHRVYLTHTG